MTRSDKKKSLSISNAAQASDSSFTASQLPDAGPVEEDSRANKRPAFPVVGVGASAGGVEALQKLCRSLPLSTGAAYVIVVHLAPAHQSQLADILAKSTSMKVLQVAGETEVESGAVYVIPPNHYLILSNGVLRLEPMPQPRPLPQAVDRLFISLAEEQQERAICIVLTGADHDGTVGLKAIKAVGGMTMAQLPETAQHPAMPESAIDTGLVDYVLPIEKMGETLAGYINRSRLWQTQPPAGPEVEENRALEEIVSLLATRGGGDFRGYKEGMLMRHSKRRMALLGLETLEAYATYLRENPLEIRALGEDFLIKVTEFSASRLPGSRSSRKFFQE
jgi:two-component system CheB/CheR fusion protein